MPNNLLVLHPADWQFCPSTPELLTDHLRRLGFAGESFPYRGELRLRAGERFLEHITFLGCSPVIATDSPAANGDFCHIDIYRSRDPLFMGGVNIKTPRCRACGYREESWSEMIEGWQADKEGYQWHCPGCGTPHSPPQLRWRQCAGFGRVFIRIWGVFEGEAVPGDRLLASLAEQSGGSWDYFYVRFDCR